MVACPCCCSSLAQVTGAGETSPSSSTVRRGISFVVEGTVGNRRPVAGAEVERLSLTGSG